MNISRAAASASVLPTADAIAWLRASTEEQTLIATLVEAATDQVEEYAGRTLVNRVVTLWLDNDEDSAPLWLPWGPVSAITSVTAYDSASTETVVSSANYALSGDYLHEVGTTQGWAYACGRAYKSVKVIYTAGYGATASSVPEGLIQAVKHLSRDLYEARQSEIVGNVISAYSNTWRTLIDPYRQGQLAGWSQR